MSFDWLSRSCEDCRAILARTALYTVMGSSAMCRRWVIELEQLSYFESIVSMPCCINLYCDSLSVDVSYDATLNQGFDNNGTVVL